MTVQRYLQIQQQSQNMGSSGQHRKLDRSLSEPKSAKGQNQSMNSSRYKTELCRPYEESGVCKYGDKCQFAHGFQELRSLTRHPKYKTELCCTFHTTGLCPYGSRCHFIHNPDENRAKILPTLPLQQAISQQSHSQQLQNGKHSMHGGNVVSQAIGMTAHSSSVSSAAHHHQSSSLRSLSIGSNGSSGSNSSGELSPSSSPGMFDDPFSPGFYGASSSPSSGRNHGMPNPFSTFGPDFEMTTLAAAFTAAESSRNNNGLLKNVTSAPTTPPFGSQINLLSSSSGPWGSPSSTDLFQFPAGNDIHCPLLSQSSLSQQKLFEQSSPVDAMSFDFDAMSLSSAASSIGSSLGSSSALSRAMSPQSRMNQSPYITRLPIFNQIAHSD